MPLPTALERIGNVLAERYLLEELLARGGMGVLYLGRHLLTGRRVAVKVMRPERDEIDTVEAERFLREARAAAGLEHPNVVQVFDMGVDQGAWFLVMELLEGESLGVHLQREGVLTPAQALQWLLPVMGALACAHDHGVVHRDVKPENIFLARRGPQHVPTLLDFGIAKHTGATTLTERGMAIGTPMFMSPEQARGDARVGPQSDVWSMGVVFHLCLTGRLPFEADNPASVLVKILSQPAPRLTTRAGWLPKKVAASIDRALIMDLGARYADMREFARGLVSAAAGVVPLPDDPDPVGLPEYRAWVRGAPFGGGAALEPLPALDAATQDAFEPPSRSGMRRSASPPSGFARLRGRWPLLVLALLAALAGALLAWRELDAPVPSPSPLAAPQRTPASSASGAVPRAAPGPAPAGRPEPLAPVVEPMTDEEAVGSPTVEADEPEAKRRRRPRSVRSGRRRSRPPARPAPRSLQDSSGSSPVDAPPAAADEADPFRIRREYKTP